MMNPTRWIAVSVLVGTAAALFWMRAPMIPAMAGGAGAGMLLFLRARRATT